MEKKIYIGNLDIKISILEKEIIRTETGSVKEGEDVVLKKVWGKVEFGTGEEKQDGREYSKQTIEIVIRYSKEILKKATKLFLEIEGQKYNVVAAVPYGPGRKSYLKLKAVLRDER